MMPAELVVHPFRITIQKNFPNALTAVYGIYKDQFDVPDMVFGVRKEGRILIQKIAEQKGVGVACRLPDEILGRVEVWMRFGEVFGAIIVGSRVTGEEIGCYFWGAGRSDSRIELVVLRVEQSADGGEIVNGDGVEEEKVVRGHFVFGRGSFRLLTSV